MIKESQSEDTGSCHDWLYHVTPTTGGRAWCSIQGRNQREDYNTLGVEVVVLGYDPSGENLGGGVYPGDGGRR